MYTHIIDMDICGIVTDVEARCESLSRISRADRFYLDHGSDRQAMGWAHCIPRAIQGVVGDSKNCLAAEGHHTVSRRKLPISPRFRGLLALRRYPNGEERCIRCKLWRRLAQH